MDIFSVFPALSLDLVSSTAIVGESFGVVGELGAGVFLITLLLANLILLIVSHNKNLKFERLLEMNSQKLLRILEEIQEGKENQSRTSSEIKMPLSTSLSPVDISPTKPTNPTNPTVSNMLATPSLTTQMSPPPLPKMESKPKVEPFNREFIDEIKKTKTKSEKVPPTTLKPKTSLWQWVKEDWIMKVGSIMLLLALGWFVTLAFMNNWVGPTGRIIAGAIVSLGISIIGTKRFKNYPNQAGVFLTIGTITMILTMFAASNYYTILPPWLGLAISAASLWYLSHIAVANKSTALVYLSILLATIMPFLFGYLGYTEFTFGYLLVLTAYTAVINWRWYQQEMAAVSGSIVFLYSMPALMFEFNNWEAPSVITLTLVFSSIATVLAQGLYLDRNTRESKQSIFSPFNMVANILATICLIGWSMKIGSETTPGYILGAWATLTGCLSYMSFKYLKNQNALYTLWSMATLLAILSLKILLDIPALTVALIILTVFTILVAYKIGLLTNRKDLEARSSFMFLFPSLAALPSLNYSKWNVSIFQLDSLCVLMLTIAMLGIGTWFSLLNKIEYSKPRKISCVILFILGTIFGFSLLWLSLKTTLPTNLSTAVALAIYTIIGLIAYFKGIHLESTILRKYGLTIIGLIIARLFIVDLWDMETTARIITFFLVGILLVSTAFFGKKEKEKNKKI